MALKPNQIVIEKARLSYANIFTPRAMNEGDEPKYSASLIIGKNHPQVAAIQNAIQNALEQGADKFGGKIPPTGQLRNPLRDGDTERDGEEYANNFFINASTKRQPAVIDQAMNKVLDPDEVYSGCYANVLITFFAYNRNGNKGVSASLDMLQKHSDGEHLGGGRPAVEDVFSTIGGQTAPANGGFGQQAAPAANPGLGF